MSARGGLIGRLVIFGLSEQAAERAVNAFAHELAEKIRAMHCYCGCRDSADAADLIDPEVSS